MTADPAPIPCTGSTVHAATSGDDAPATLTVILPNYNHANYLPRALEALLAQDLPGFEIIVVDDGSTDNSLEVLNRFAADFPSIKIIANPRNQGAIAALARGLDATKARYVYFAAADDWVMPGFFATAIAALDANPELGLFCGEALLINATSGEVLGVRPPVRPRHAGGSISAASARKLLRRSDNWILTGSAVFRRDFVLEAGGFDPELGSFADGFMGRKVALTRGFYFSPHPVSAWTISPASLSVRTALESSRNDQALHVARRLASDPAFPDWYGAIFTDRYIFSALRLTLFMATSEAQLRDSLALLRHSPVDRALTNLVVRRPKSRLARTALIAWLWCRYRPYPLFEVARTLLARRSEGLPPPLAPANDPSSKSSHRSHDELPRPRPSAMPIRGWPDHRDT